MQNIQVKHHLTQKVIGWTNEQANEAVPGPWYLMSRFDMQSVVLTAFSTWSHFLTRKPRKGAEVIAASMHGFGNYRKFKSPLTLDWVKITSTYTVRVGLAACPAM